MEFKFFGKYAILEKIASGGMAEIFLSADLGTAGVGRFIVIKRTLAQFSANEEFKDMFRNEGKIASNLKHRNITPVYEFGIENKQFFLAMEYVSGRNLRQILKKLTHVRNSIDISHALYIIKEVASGLNYAHNAIDSHGGEPLHLIHRDVSPQNILINFDGEIKLIDFGIAKIADTNLTQVGHLKGKFGYMSPEQAQGETLDHRTDIFSLGIILWELLANTRLFAFKNEMIALKKIKACDVPDLKKINPKIPQALIDIVNKALSKNKNLRYNTMAQMEKDLTIFLNMNYSHFSQYDLGAFMKSTYEREILKERKQLNQYSKELKSYSKKLKTINLFDNAHEQVESNHFLNMSAIDEEEDRTNVVKTKTHSAHENDANSQVTELEDASLSFSASRSQARHAPEEKSQVTKTKKGHSVDIVTKSKEQFEQLQSIKGSTITRTRTRSAYDYEFDYKKENKKSMIATLVTVVSSFILIAVGTVSLMNAEKIVNSDFINNVFKSTPSKKVNKQKKMISRKSHTPPPTKRKLASAKKRIFIETTPSGASVTINNQIQGFTPTGLVVHLNSPITLVIRKGGYVKKTFKFNSGKQISAHLKVNLMKEENAFHSIRIIR